MRGSPGLRTPLIPHTVNLCQLPGAAVAKQGSWAAKQRTLTASGSGGPKPQVQGVGRAGSFQAQRKSASQAPPLALR